MLKPTGKVTVEQVIATLTDFILRGCLTPGQQLQEINLAGQLGVSRNTLREAFRALAHEGLLVYYPHRGVFVRTITPADVRDLYRVRSLTQVAALESLPPVRNEQAIQAMREAVVAATDARRRRDWRAVGTANYAFHQAVFDLTGSQRLSRLATSLLAQTRLAFLSVDNAEVLHAPFVDDNAALLQAIEAQNYSLAVELLKRYIAQAEQRLLEQLESRAR